MKSEYYSIRFRSDDGEHRRGDVQYIGNKVLRIGQTPECELKLPAHPDYDDTCYAVIVKDEECARWRIVRQEKHAAITVNGLPLQLVQYLNDNDRLGFDRTSVVFAIENGEQPRTGYLKYRTPVWLWGLFALLFLMLSGIIWEIHEKGKRNIVVFENEIESIYKVEADTLLVLSIQNDTLDAIPAHRTFVGTGFVTDEGYFVTARHCVEFWLSMENELRPDPEEISSLIVRRAIDAETDSTVRLVSKLRVTSRNGENVWHFTSDDFLMDKTRDNIYECGNYSASYLWRSVVSLFEKRDAELGDVAVMKWPSGRGSITLAGASEIYETETPLCAFGYPQSEGDGAVFTSDEGSIYQRKESADECFICTKGFDQGFSGGPVFVKENRSVAGIVSRSSDNHTLVVPVSQIHRLIDKMENDGK